MCINNSLTKTKALMILRAQCVSLFFHIQAANLPPPLQPVGPMEPRPLRRAFSSRWVWGSSGRWRCLWSCCLHWLLCCPGWLWEWWCLTLWSTRQSQVGRKYAEKYLLFFSFHQICRVISLCVFSDIQQIITDPVQAVNDAVDEVSSLLNKFQGTEEK